MKNLAVFNTKSHMLFAMKDNTACVFIVLQNTFITAGFTDKGSPESLRYHARNWEEVLHRRRSIGWGFAQRGITIPFMVRL